MKRDNEDVKKDVVNIKVPVEAQVEFLKAQLSHARMVAQTAKDDDVKAYASSKAAQYQKRLAELQELAA